MSRYVVVAQIECNEVGKLGVTPNVEGVVEERDFNNLKSPIPFLRYAIVDRTAKNKTVFSNKSLSETIKKRNELNAKQPKPKQISRAAAQKRLQLELKKMKMKWPGLAVQPAVAQPVLHIEEYEDDGDYQDFPPDGQ